MERHFPHNPHSNVRPGGTIRGHTQTLKVIFAAIAKSTRRIFFHLENPEISAVLDLKLLGDRRSKNSSEGPSNFQKKKIIFFLLIRVETEGFFRLRA